MTGIKLNLSMFVRIALIHLRTVFLLKYLKKSELRTRSGPGHSYWPRPGSSVFSIPPAPDLAVKIFDHGPTPVTTLDILKTPAPTLLKKLLSGRVLPTILVFLLPTAFSTAEGVIFFACGLT